jgi:hypothetical protein
MSKDDLEQVKSMLVNQNQQLLIANKMLHAFLCALMSQKHNGSVILDKDAVERDFNNYNVTWDPVVTGSTYWLLSVKPKQD